DEEDGVRGAVGVRNLRDRQTAVVGRRGGAAADVVGRRRGRGRRLAEDQVVGGVVGDTAAARVRLTGARREVQRREVGGDHGLEDRRRPGRGARGCLVALAVRLRRGRRPRHVGGDGDGRLVQVVLFHEGQQVEEDRSPASERAGEGCDRDRRLPRRRETPLY